MLQLNVNSITRAEVDKTLQDVVKNGQVIQEYKDYFDKIGRFPGEKYKIKLIEHAQLVIHPPRLLPVHIMPLYKAEIDKMLKDGIISPDTETTDWVNSIVCNIKETTKGKKVQLCLDPKDLNRNTRREHYYSRMIDEILPQLHKKISVVDTKKGYWHIELDEESSLLCTFNTPFGRFTFNRLPFRIKVSQDVFQRKLDEACQGIDNVCGIANDIIIACETAQEHNTAMVKMLEASRKK